MLFLAPRAAPGAYAACLLRYPDRERNLIARNAVKAVISRGESGLTPRSRFARALLFSRHDSTLRLLHNDCKNSFAGRTNSER